jgi:hypothetical protein
LVKSQAAAKMRSFFKCDSFTAFSFTTQLLVQFAAGQRRKRRRVIEAANEAMNPSTAERRKRRRVIEAANEVMNAVSGEVSFFENFE